MSLSRIGSYAGFDFSKVKLKPRKINSEDFHKTKVNKISKSSIKGTRIHRLDFLTLIIPFLCLFFVTMLICGVNMFKTLLFSPSSGADYDKHSHALTPNIQIIEPSSSVAPRNNYVGLDIRDTEFIYLTP